MTQPNASEPHPLVRIATLERKVTELEQRIEKIESRKDHISESSPLIISPTEKPKTDKENKLFEIVKVDTRIIEANESWSKVSWKLILKSFADVPLGFGTEIEFVDKDGFVIDSTFQSEVLLSNQNEQTFTGYYLIDASLIGSVASIQAKVRLS